MATLGSFLQGIDSLNIEWGKTWLWDIQFGGGAGDNTAPPSPFDKWFPASDYNETALISNTLVENFYLSQYKFLQTTSCTDIQMTVHDDVNCTLYKWLSDWYNTAYDSSDGVCMLQDAWRQLNVMKLNAQREPVMLYTYFVIPEGSITELLHSSSDIKTYAISFAVIGRLPVQTFSYPTYEGFVNDTHIV